MLIAILARVDVSLIMTAFVIASMVGGAIANWKKKLNQGPQQGGMTRPPTGGSRLRLEELARRRAAQVEQMRRGTATPQARPVAQVPRAVPPTRPPQRVAPRPQVSVPARQPQPVQRRRPGQPVRMAAPPAPPRQVPVPPVVLTPVDEDAHTRISAAPETRAASTVAAPQGVRGRDAILAALSSTSLKQAVIMKELLDRPLALR